MENCNCRNTYYRNRMTNSSQNNFCQNRNTCAVSGVEEMSLAMAYVPWQHWKDTYETCKALSIGTIFPELNLPFLERSCGR